MCVKSANLWKSVCLLLFFQVRRASRQNQPSQKSSPRASDGLHWTYSRTFISHAQTPTNTRSALYDVAPSQHALRLEAPSMLNYVLFVSIRDLRRDGRPFGLRWERKRKVPIWLVHSREKMKCYWLIEERKWCVKNRKWNASEVARLKTWLCPSKETPALYLLFVFFSSIQLVRKLGRFPPWAASTWAVSGIDKFRFFCTGTSVDINMGANKDVSRISLLVNIVACIWLRNTMRQKENNKRWRFCVNFFRALEEIKYLTNILFLRTVKHNRTARDWTPVCIVHRKKGRVYEFWHHVMWPASWHICITCKYCERLSLTVCSSSFVAQRVLETQMKGSGTQTQWKQLLRFETLASL